MSKLTVKCPSCNKLAELIKEETSKSLGVIFKTYSCGHTATEKFIAQKWPPNRDEKWNLTRRYQQEAIEFIENSNFNCLIADEMGLGKTIEVLAALRYSREKLTPTIFIVKSSLKYNWASEIQKWVWTNGKPNGKDLPFIIPDGQCFLFPGFDFYIVSMSVLNKYIDQIIQDIKPKLVVIDESHNFKNPDAQRTSALQKIAKCIPHKICTSGTPILNNADEFFTTLNLIRPAEWPIHRSFRWHWVESLGPSKFGGIIKYKQDEFKQKTSHYILRRLKKEVLQDLPEFSRNFKIIDISESEFVDAYNNQADLLEAYLNSQEYQKTNGFERATNTLALLAKMRHLAGLMKAIPCAEDVTEFLELTDEKICIGVHHHDVAAILQTALRRFNPIMLSGKDDAESKHKKEQDFKKPENRVMICSILAGGEGLNLQFCSNAIILERQWNVMKERQFEGRFHRFGQTQPVSCDYLIAKKTVDEFLTELIHKKKFYTDTAVEIDVKDENVVSVGWEELAREVAGRKIT